MIQLSSPQPRRFRGLGLSLLEIIAALILSSIMAALFIQVMGSSLTASSTPVLHAQNAYYLQEVMETMTVDFKRLLAEGSGGAQTPIEAFRDRVKNKVYGTYDLVYGDGSGKPPYISFDGSGNETSGGSNIVKVTISHEGQSLTALFTQ